MEAVRADWAKLRGRGPNGTAPAAERSTVPGNTGPDPALAKLKADSALAVPPPAAIREQLAQVTGKLTEKTRATA